mmetsp:Transcript_69384/g.219561  ORF Transcript_69384/g.219561 Transcript_69384/m.219561 type:complete len:214 (+) Transcript_69384:592-1233(+)
MCSACPPPEREEGAPACCGPRGLRATGRVAGGRGVLTNTGPGAAPEQHAESGGGRPPPAGCVQEDAMGAREHDKTLLRGRPGERESRHQRDIGGRWDGVLIRRARGGLVVHWARAPGVEERRKEGGEGGWGGKGREPVGPCAPPQPPQGPPAALGGNRAAEVDSAARRGPRGFRREVATGALSGAGRPGEGGGRVRRNLGPSRTGLSVPCLPS